MLIGVSATRAIGSEHIVDAMFFDVGRKWQGEELTEPLVLLITDATTSEITRDGAEPYRVIVRGERAMRVWGVVEGLAQESGWPCRG